MRVLLITAVLTATMATSAWAHTAYDDVTAGHWTYGILAMLQDAGVLEGYPEDFFNGDRTLTRYEFAQATARILDSHYEDDGPPSSVILYSILAGEFSDQLSEVSCITPSIEENKIREFTGFIAGQSERIRSSLGIDPVWFDLQYVPGYPGGVYQDSALLTWNAYGLRRDAIEQSVDSAGNARGYIVYHASDFRYTAIASLSDLVISRFESNRLPVGKYTSQYLANPDPAQLDAWRGCYGWDWLDTCHTPWGLLLIDWHAQRTNLAASQAKIERSLVLNPDPPGGV